MKKYLIVVVRVFQDCRKPLAVLFDLDGVIVNTEPFHYETWKRLAFEENWQFNEEIAMSLKGKGRRDSLDCLLSYSMGISHYNDAEKDAFCERKNVHYLELIENISESFVCKGIRELLDVFKSEGIVLAVASSSKNAGILVSKLGLMDYFSCVIDGNRNFASKPAPDIFLACANEVGIAVNDCWVVEDAPAGVKAAKAAGMFCVSIGLNEEADVCFADAWSFWKWVSAGK